MQRILSKKLKVLVSGSGVVALISFMHQVLFCSS